MLKVYIDDNAFNVPRPMEVSADAIVADLVPALVEELNLPLTDLFGNRLVYILRHADDGWVIPEFSSLAAANIQPETHLALVSYIEDEFTVLAAPSRSAITRNASFYTGQTIADSAGFSVAENAASSPYLQNSPARSGARSSIIAPAVERRWSRRSLFLVGGAALGVAGLGLTYAAYRSLTGTAAPKTAINTSQAASTVKPATTATHSPQTFLPTKATMQLSFTQHQQTVRALSWSPAGNQLASGGSDRMLLTWNTAGQVQLRKTQNATILATAWSPDSQHLAAAIGKQVLFLNAQSGATEGRSGNVHKANVTALAWSTQQPLHLVSGGLDKLAIVWNTQTFKPQTLFKLHTTGILATTWASNGQSVGTSSQGGAIRIWNGANAQEVHGSLNGGTAVNALAFQPGGTLLAAGGADGMLRLWQNGLVCQVEGTGQTKGQCTDKPQLLPGHKGAIHTLGWAPDGRLLASADDKGQLFVWYPAQSQTPLLKITQNAPILALAWSPDGKKLASASGKTVTLWSLA